MNGINPDFLLYYLSFESGPCPIPPSTPFHSLWVDGKRERRVKITSWAKALGPCSQAESILELKPPLVYGVVAEGMPIQKSHPRVLSLEKEFEPQIQKKQAVTKLSIRTKEWGFGLNFTLAFLSFFLGRTRSPTAEWASRHRLSS